jgi:hypothetical protein
MRSIFNPEDRRNIIHRVNALTPDSKALWGKMNVSQMVRHCASCEEYYFGDVRIKRSFLGRLIGQFAIKGMLKDDKTVLTKNAPTARQFKATENVPNLGAEKEKWKGLLEKYGSYDHEYFVHWFFGKMSKEQLGQFVYKHCDHHLRQFGC